MSGANYARDPKPDNEGRWPANLCLDESAAAMLDEQTGVLKSGALKPYKERHESATSYKMDRDKTYDVPANEGGASRFFYVAKASRSEREAGLNGNGARANTHPTVKPIALMRWLIRLITPPNGIVLDPFNGSGTTGIAAIQEGMRYLGIEISPDYAQLAERRIAHALEAAA
jgi:site-specific DNA-methyltransferase (adenine-specific)